MKKVLIITYYWPPAGGAGVQRWLHFTKHLPEFGWEPVILTVSPESATYPQKDDSLNELVNPQLEVIRTNSFEPLGVYGKVFGKKKIPYGGFSNAEKSGGLIRFIRGNFFIPDARKGWNRFAIKSAKQRIAKGDIDLIITTGPPHSTHLIGKALQRKFQLPWLVDLRDPWSKVFYNDVLKRMPFAKSKDLALEKDVLGSADVCVTVSDGFAASFKTIVDRDYTIITNGYTTADVEVAEVKKPIIPTIAYIGSMADSYQPSSLFEAIAAVSGPEFEFRIAGSLSLQIEKLIVDKGLKDKTNFLGYVSYDDASREMKEASLLIIITPQGESGMGILPGKLFEYLKTGVPILCLSDEGSEISKILKDTGAGKSFTRSQILEMKNYIQDVLSGSVKGGNPEKVKQYSRKSLTGDMSKVMDDLISAQKL